VSWFEKGYMRLQRRLRKLCWVLTDYITLSYVLRDDGENMREAREGQDATKGWRNRMDNNKQEKKKKTMGLDCLISPSFLTRWWYKRQQRVIKRDWVWKGSRR
jgi:hypothetical protein